MLANFELISIITSRWNVSNERVSEKTISRNKLRRCTIYMYHHLSPVFVFFTNQSLFQRKTFTTLSSLLRTATARWGRLRTLGMVIKPIVLLNQNFTNQTIKRENDFIKYSCQWKNTSGSVLGDQFYAPFSLIFILMIYFS